MSLRKKIGCVSWEVGKRKRPISSGESSVKGKCSSRERETERKRVFDEKILN